MLYWTAQDKTGAEMAIFVEASENTVKRHLQHIFPKLGVENRIAATLCALRVFGPAGAGRAVNTFRGYWGGMSGSDPDAVHLKVATLVQPRAGRLRGTALERVI